MMAFWSYRSSLVTAEEETEKEKNSFKANQ